MPLLVVLSRAQIIIWKSYSLQLLWCLNVFSYSEKVKVEGEELQEWLKLVVAPTELVLFVKGKQESKSLLPLQAGSG